MWPFRRRGRYALTGALPESLLLTEDVLRQTLEDLFAVKERQAQGLKLRWGGQLRIPPASALPIIEHRFKPYGFTPFLKRERDMTWIEAVPLAAVASRQRTALNVSLFLLTVLSTFVAGALPMGAIPFVNWNPFEEPLDVLRGVEFAGTLLAILVTHEFGHYFTARFYRAAVTLPFFIPVPPPFLFGTLGAIISMRSPTRDRNSLFDIAVAGPLAGLAVALPALWLGLRWSHVDTIPDGGSISFGDSLLTSLLTYLRFGPIPDGQDVFIHPMALAAWVGLFVTALNLFPVGQLDGGRIAYALLGPRHRAVSIGTFFALLALGIFAGSPNWFVFAGLVFLLVGFHHAPPLDDLTPLSPGRYAVGVFCLVLLVLLIPPVPIQVFGQ
ncbi:MAG: site-2 protease family protein [Candidatus Rokuibacteriota bacterium]|nr:MAG: site-2 protease family protein [Candidatus Rokubacteria bacterium]